MVRSWKNKMPQPELLDVSQSLHLGTVQDLQEQTVDGNASVNGILDDLGPLQWTHSPVFQSLSPT